MRGQMSGRTVSYVAKCALTQTRTILFTNANATFFFIPPEPHRHSYFNPQSYSCGTEHLCKMFRHLPVDGQCMEDCPDGYSHITDPRKPRDFNNCHPCPNGRCLRICETPKDESFVFDPSEKMYKCQGYNGSLKINLRDPGKVTRTLMYGYFADVEVIYGTLEVESSTVLQDLGFFESLRLVDPLPHELLEGRLAVRIVGNEAMSELIDWNIHGDINVTRGEVLVADNTHLCPETRVREFLQHVWLLDRNASAEMWMAEEELDSNGYQAVCRHRDFASRVVKVEHDRVRLQWRRFVPADGLKVSGYHIMYTVTSEEGEPPAHQEGIDLCSE